MLKSGEASEEETEFGIFVLVTDEVEHIRPLTDYPSAGIKG
jgi:hypothetical protein